jgi:hypothetical protein
MRSNILKILEGQREAATQGTLNMWTVYDHPTDFPHSYVARRFEVGGGKGGPVATTDIVQGELSIIRESFRHCGLTCLDRNEGDDPNIVETWL